MSESAKERGGSNISQELFRFPWPGPGNSEGPVDPDGWSQVESVDHPFVESAGEGLWTDSPWPGPGDSEG